MKDKLSLEDIEKIRSFIDDFFYYGTDGSDPLYMSEAFYELHLFLYKMRHKIKNYHDYARKNNLIKK